MPKVQSVFPPLPGRRPQKNICKCHILPIYWSCPPLCGGTVKTSTEATGLERISSDYKLLTGLYFRLLPYQILLIVINAVNGIIDSLYASNVIGQTAMSAIGLFGPFNHFLYAAGMMLVSGSQILYGRYLANEREKISDLFSVNLMISFALSLVTALLLAAAALTGAMRFMVSQQPDLQMLNRYILGQALGIPPLLMGQQLFAFLSLENQTRRTMTASVVCFAANVVFDHLFVLVFSMGPFGLGFATALSNWVFFAILAAWYLSGKSEWKFSLRVRRWDDAARIVRLGYPGALSRFMEMFRCLIVNYLILKYVGSAGIASFSASNSVLAVFWPVAFGMMAVSRMLFSISIGEEDRRSLVDTMKIALTRGTLLIFAVVAVLVSLAVPLTRLFYRDAAEPVYQMTVMGFRLMPLCMPLAQLSLQFACYAQTAEKRALSVALPMVDGMIGVVLFSLLLIPSLKMNGLYLANILNGVLCAALITFSARAALKRFPRSLEDLMAIPARIGVSEDERLDITVRSMDEVITVSQRVIAFCRTHDIDRRRTFFAGLCLEEMAGNVVSHGFVKDRKHHSVDIRVVHKDGAIIMSMRDNCIAFNPADRVKAMEPDGSGKNVGIQLVYLIADHVSYQNLLGLNVLTIRI